MGILSFFLSPITALVIGLTLGGGAGFIKGHDFATAKYRVAALQTQVSELEKAAEDKERLIDEDRRTAEALEIESAALRKQIEGFLHATPAQSASCRLSDGQLRIIRDIATR